jgi:transposase
MLYNILRLVQPLNHCLILQLAMKRIPQDKLNSVILHLRNGLSYREIARKATISYVTVHNIAKWNGIEQPRDKKGPPSKLNQVVKRNIIRNIVTGKCDTATKATTILRQDSNINVSAQTDRRIFKSN